ncbi:MAG: TetR/AcrR family transcriptional regulator [Aeromicrobium sp.]
MTRRDDLLDRATDHALEHGLIGLSLRPTAAALGTSDRMLIYHFGSKDALVAAVLTVSNDRSIAAIRALEPSATPRQAILDLWDAWTAPALARCTRMYVEAAALGLFGREPYAASVREANERWIAAVTAHLERAGLSSARAGRVATLVDATYNGLLLDRQLDDDAEPHRVVTDLADALG